MTRTTLRCACDPTVEEAAHDVVVLAALRRWITCETGAGELSDRDAVHAYESLGSYFLARLCDRFTEVTQVRAFSLQLLWAIARDLERGAPPPVGVGRRLFLQRVLAFLETQTGRRDTGP